jgi:DNA-binding transcriptional MerR regulator
MAKKPTKLYYSITEVGELLDLKPHILRYWETEFPILHPKKNRAGNRAYRRKDIDIARTVKHLLYDEGFTIDGARKKLNQL